MDDSRPSENSGLQRPLDYFRANTKRRKIHPLELKLLWVVSLHLVFLPWAIGGMRLWGQLISLALALAGFALALVPRIYSSELTEEEGRYRLNMAAKLVRFPLFWLGLAFLAYVAIQGLNPAWAYRTDGKGWWMERLDFIPWLPSGVDVPLDRGGGPWRSLIIYASAWLTMCTIWVGFTRRRTVQFFFVVIAANGFLLAAFGLLQRLLSNGKLFWVWTSPNDTFFSSFIYKNHAGAYLNLTLAVACGLAAWYYLRGLRRMEKSNPAGLMVFFATLIAVSVLVSYARGATLIMMVFLGVTAGAFILHQLFAPAATRRPLVAIVLMIIIGLFLKSGLESLQVGEAWRRLNRAFSSEDTSLHSRQVATSAALDMLKDYWARGTGAGGFRYLFPAYQQNYPEIMTDNGQPLFWEHAHNDIVEFPIELGVAGMLILLLGFIWWLRLQLKNRFWRNSLGLAVIFGGFLTVIHSRWDFLFQCPAILVLWCALFTATALWSAFEARGSASM